MAVKIDRSVLEFKRGVREVKKLFEQYETLGFFLFPRGKATFLVCQWKKENVVGRLRKSKFLIYSSPLRRLLEKSLKLEKFLV